MWWLYLSLHYLADNKQHKECSTYAPINCLPHYPGTGWGQVEIWQREWSNTTLGRSGGQLLENWYSNSWEKAVMKVSPQCNVSNNVKQEIIWGFNCSHIYTCLLYVTRSAKINHVSAQNCHVFSTLCCYNLCFSIANKTKITPHVQKFMENLIKLTKWNYLL